IGAFEGRSALGSWLYRVTTNAALIKRRGKRADMEISVDDLPSFLPDGHRAGDRAFLMTDWSLSPEEIALSQESRDELSRALDDLPEHYRAVLVLRDVEGLSNEAVAEALDDTLGSVKARLH